MTTTPQTEASRLADGLLAETSKFGTPSIQRGLVNGAIQELRRLDAENQRQRADLERKSEAIQRLWAERDQLRAQVERLQATEPFGYFRAEPMGWTDCAATDEGAIALYERPAASSQTLTDEVFAALELDPEAFRTEGGAVNAGKLKAAILHPYNYLHPDHWLQARFSKPGGRPLVTDQAALSDEDIDKIADDYEDECGRIRVDQVFAFARAIIAALREKEGGV